MGVKWRVGPANGRKPRKEKGLLVGLKYQRFCSRTEDRRAQMGICVEWNSSRAEKASDCRRVGAIRAPASEGGRYKGRAPLFVQGGVEDGDEEVGEVGRTFVHLQPADDAMVGKVFGDASLGYTQVLGKLGLDGRLVASCGAAADQIGNGDAQSLAGLDVIVGCEVGIGKDPNAGSSGSAIGVV